MATPIPRNEARFTLDEVATACSAHVAIVGREAFAGVVVDSREVFPGAIFVALRGARHDAHAFLPQAFASGVGAVIVDREIGEVPPGVSVLVVPDTLRALGDLAAFHRRRHSIPVVAITGSVGKTTTKDLTAAGLRALGLRVHETPGNLNNLVGVPMTLFGLGRDHDVAVLELGMSVPGEIARLAEIATPDVAVVTAVAEAHTEGVGTLEDIAREKGALLLALCPEGAAVWTADDPLIAPYGVRSAARTKLTFGLRDDADVRLIEHRLVGLRTHLVLAIGDESLPVELDLVGEGPARSAAAAIATVLATRGRDALETAIVGMSGLQPREGRACPLKGPRGSTILDDTYNASPRATALALQTAVELARRSGGRAIAVLGDMRELGPESTRLHERVGDVAVAAGVAVLICCGEEMRAAAGSAERASATRGTTGMRIESVADTTTAFELVRDLVRKGDVVLVKGSRTMQMERVVEALSALAREEGA
jgi:UDP-N-acetylmuramoyl-tripeptide--D-alanyl-D-alanine ligase